MELMEKRGLDSCLSFLDKKVHPCPRNFSAKLFSLAGQCATTRAKLRPSMDEVRTHGFIQNQAHRTMENLNWIHCVSK